MIRLVLVPLIWLAAALSWLLACVLGAAAMNTSGAVAVRSIVLAVVLAGAGVGCGWLARSRGRPREPTIPWPHVIALPEYPMPRRWRPPLPNTPLPSDRAAAELLLVRTELLWLANHRLLPMPRVRVFRSRLLRFPISAEYACRHPWRMMLVGRGPWILSAFGGGPLLAALFGLGGGGELLSQVVRGAAGFDLAFGWAITLTALVLGAAGAYLLVRNVVLGVRRSFALLRRERESSAAGRPGTDLGVAN